MIAATKALTSRLAIVYPWALNQLSSSFCLSLSNRAIVALALPRSSQSTQMLRPRETGNPQDSQAYTVSERSDAEAEEDLLDSPEAKPSGACHKTGSAGLDGCATRAGTEGCPSAIECCSASMQLIAVATMSASLI